MARRRSSDEQWSGSLHLHRGALGPIAGKSARQIAAEGLKRARELHDADPVEAVKRRIQVLINLNHPQSGTLRAAIKLLDAGKVVANPSPAGDTRRTRPTRESTMAKRTMPSSPGIRLARAIMKATKGVIPKGTSRAKRGAIVKAANARLQPRITGNTIPSVDQIKAALRASLGATSGRKKAAKKKAAPKRGGRKKAAKKKAAPKRAGRKKAAKKKPRTAAQKAATKRMIAANRAKRGGKKAAKKKAAPKRGGRKKAAKKKPRTAAQKAATKRMIAANRKKRGGARPATKTGQRAAAVRGRKLGKKGRGGVTPGNRKRDASPTMKQRDVAATFGLKGSRAFEQSLVNLTGEGVVVGKVTTVFYTSAKNPDVIYRHHFKKNQRPTLYMDVAAWNHEAAQKGVSERASKGSRKMTAMGGRWVELGEAQGCNVIVAHKTIKLQFGRRGALPRLLANESNDRLAMTWYGGGMKRAPHVERVMFLQKARGAVVSTRGIIS